MSFKFPEEQVSGKIKSRRVLVHVSLSVYDSFSLLLLIFIISAQFQDTSKNAIDFFEKSCHKIEVPYVKRDKNVPRRR